MLFLLFVGDRHVCFNFKEIENKQHLSHSYSFPKKEQLPSAFAKRVVLFQSSLKAFALSVLAPCH